VGIAPGKSVVISVKITPKAEAGSIVQGVLNLVTTPIGVNPLFNTTGDVIARLPYQYTVG
jgi:hypothetical protein